MKKTYIEPKNTVVYVDLHHMIATSERRAIGDSVESASGADARDVINAPDAWDEW